MSDHAEVWPLFNMFWQFSQLNYFVSTSEKILLNILQPIIGDQQKACRKILFVNLYSLVSKPQLPPKFCIRSSSRFLFLL